jgi:hypothetical protein
MALSVLIWARAVILLQPIVTSVADDYREL